jgi:CheY-like chemotaxis protein
MGSRRPWANIPKTGAIKMDGRRILVVDDDMRTVYALSATLRAKGAMVLTADSGRAALEVLAQGGRLDAVLMDIMMPEMDGYEAMGRIRQEPQWRELLIVALTAKAMAGDEQKCLSAGASAYLPKPIDADRLLALLDHHLNQVAVNVS